MPQYLYILENVSQVNKETRMRIFMTMCMCVQMEVCLFCNSEERKTSKCLARNE